MQLRSQSIPAPRRPVAAKNPMNRKNVELLSAAIPISSRKNFIRKTEHKKGINIFVHMLKLYLSSRLCVYQGRLKRCLLYCFEKDLSPAAALYNMLPPFRTPLTNTAQQWWPMICQPCSAHLHGAWLSDFLKDNGPSSRGGHIGHRQ